MKFWISGYSRGSQPSAALYDWKQEAPLWQASLDNPSYLCRRGDFLFALGEFDEYGTLSSFRRNGNDWVPVDTIRLEGGALCHITTDPAMTFLAGSCWGTGHFFTIRLNSDGTFGKLLFHQKLDDGTGRRSRMHFSCILGDCLYAVNIELDAVFCFRLERGVPVFVSILKLPSGCGPRHFYPDKRRKLFYCVTEYSSQLLVIDASRPENLRLIAGYPLLDKDFHGESTGSTLAVTRDGRDLYAANRGEDTIVHFHLETDGTPVLRDRVSCCGRCPRHIALLDDDRILGIANQNSDEVILLKRAPEDGSLGTLPVRRIAFPSPSFIREEYSL